METSGNGHDASRGRRAGEETTARAADAPSTGSLPAAGTSDGVTRLIDPPAPTFIDLTDVHLSGHATSQVPRLPLRPQQGESPADAPGREPRNETRRDPGVEADPEPGGRDPSSGTAPDGVRWRRALRSLDLLVPPRLLTWITGRETFPGDRRAELALYQALALSVLVTSGMAFVSALILSAMVMPGSPLAGWVLAAVLWSAVVFSIELLIVRQVSYSTSGLGVWAGMSQALIAGFAFLLRLGLATGVAFLIAEPVITVVFSDVITAQAEMDRQQAVARLQSDKLVALWTDWYQTDVGDVADKREAVRTATDAVVRQRQELRRQLTQKTECGPAGDGACARTAKDTLRRLNLQVVAAQQACESAVATATGRRGRLQHDAEEYGRRQEERLERSSGMLDRLGALHNVEALRSQEDESAAQDQGAPATSAQQPTQPAATVGRPDLTLSCSLDENVTLPTREDVAAAAAAALQPAAASRTAPLVTAHKAWLVWAAHWVFRVVLVIVDLFPLTTKLTLRYSVHARRTKEWSRSQGMTARTQTEIEVGRLQLHQQRVLDLEGIQAGQASTLAQLKARTETETEAERSRHDIDENKRDLEHQARVNLLRRRRDHDRVVDEWGLAGIGEAFVPPVPRTGWRPERNATVNDRWLLTEQMGDASSLYATLWKGVDLKASPDGGDRPAPVVVKLLAVSEKADRRLEIDAVKRLPPGAPHIAPVLEAGAVEVTDRGPDGPSAYHFLVHPLYPLGSLHDYMASRRRPLRYCLAIADQVLLGLFYAHRDGRLLHLDIKPSNIVMASLQSVHIIDWGLSVSGSPSERVDYTTGRGQGTLGYGAPEQFLRGPGEDPRSELSDVYGVGATVYWLLTGQPPLFREYRAATGTLPSDGVAWYKFLADRPELTPPSHYLPGLPAGIDELVMRWLAWDPAERVHRARPDQHAAEAARQPLRTVMAELGGAGDMIVGPSAVQEPVTSAGSGAGEPEEVGTE